MARFKKHGMFGTPEYTSWVEMKRRCEQNHRHNYCWYGARNIKVCERWQNFSLFFEDMGKKPSIDCTIDCIDQAGNYEPSNCRWATSKQQNNNRRGNRIVNYNNELMTLQMALDKAGNVVRHHTARSRLDRGWPVEKAVETRPGRY